MNLKDIEESLEQVFHVAFDIKQLKDGFVVSPEGSDNSQFEIKANIKDGVRLTIKARPEIHGADFLRLLNKSTKQKRTIFNQLIKTNTNGEIEININKNVVDPDDFVDNSEDWKSFELRFSELGFDNSIEEVSRACILLISMILTLVDYSIEGFEEGAAKTIASTRYERNPINRYICLETKGYKCSVCGVLLEDIYGPIAASFIEVHHSIPVSEMEEGHIVDPIKELFPVCPNCHSMLHRKAPPYTIEEMKQIINSHKGN